MARFPYKGLTVGFNNVTEWKDDSYVDTQKDVTVVETHDQQ